MRQRFQLGLALMALAALFSAAAPLSARQKPQSKPATSPPAPSHPQNSKPPASHPPASHPPASHPSSAPPPSSTNPNHPPSSTASPASTPPHSSDRPPSASEAPHNNFAAPSGDVNRATNPNRPPDSGARLSPRQQLGVGAPRPWVDQMRSLTPQQRDQVLQRSKAFQNLSPEQQNRIRQQFNQWDRMTPQQRADQQIKEDNWRRLSPEQREHIKTNIVPRWKQLPWDRQQVLKQKLGVLQNMPESARNQRLNDPNFTKGMTDDEKSLLNEISHTHLGGAPELPAE